MKAAIIGYSGSGKSTLAGFLGRVFDAPVLYLDRMYWLPGWTHRSREEQEEIVRSFLDKNDRWVIDGNYFKILSDRRLDESNMIVIMKFGRIACLVRAIKRYRKYKGSSRDSMTEGCQEKLDCEFIRWILRNGRKKAVRRLYRDVAAKYSDKTVIIRNQRQLDRFMKEKYRG